ncbi:MAG: hypothetical protein OEZ59_03670 [Deltaproteobacteria bacterium]|nr:hypothetical protein [Deltaproteobacteria bacterium]
MAREVTAQVRPPRTLLLRYPFGHPLGEPGNTAQHRRILLDLLDLLENSKTPGEMLESPYRWKRHDFSSEPS